MSTYKIPEPLIEAFGNQLLRLNDPMASTRLEEADARRLADVATAFAKSRATLGYESSYTATVAMVEGIMAGVICWREALAELDLQTKLDPREYR